MWKEKNKINGVLNFYLRENLMYMELLSVSEYECFLTSLLNCLQCNNLRTLCFFMFIPHFKQQKHQILVTKACTSLRLSVGVVATWI